MKLIEFEEACKKAYMANSYSRLDTVLSLRSKMQSDEWLRLLGEMWNCCDNIGLYRLRLRSLIGTDGGPDCVPQENSQVLQAENPTTNHDH